MQSILSDETFEVAEAHDTDGFATIAWLRAAVSRFANGEKHELRRRRAVRELRRLEPDELRWGAYQRAHAALASAGDSGNKIDAVSWLARLPMATLAAAQGIADPERGAVAVIAPAGAYPFPGADAEAQRLADAGTAELVEMLSPADIDTVVARIALMVEGCHATAGPIGLTLLKLQEQPRGRVRLADGSAD